jgi:Patatin-like phospholipase
MADFHILSLDGGGSWALIEVMALMDLFGGRDARGHDVLRRFDLIAANSGGALVAGGLVKNMTLGELFDLFADSHLNKRAMICPPLAFFSDVTDRVARVFGIGARFDTQKKFEGLTTILGAEGNREIASLPDWIGPGAHDRRPQLVICGFDYDINRACFFRSDGHSLSGSFAQHPSASLAEAIHASANPPVNYFNNPAGFGGRRYWDGGIGGYNNPVLAAVIEAIANATRYNTMVSEIRVLSLGTGSIVLPFVRVASSENSILVAKREKRSLKADLAKLATSILDDPPDAASFHAHILLRGRLPTDVDNPVDDGPIIRMNPLVQPIWNAESEHWDCPPGLDARTFDALTRIDADTTKQEEVDMVRALCEAWLNNGVLNQPIRAASDTLATEIGHRWYRDARVQAQAFGF